MEQSWLQRTHAEGSSALETPVRPSERWGTSRCSETCRSRKSHRMWSTLTTLETASCASGHGTHSLQRSNGFCIWAGGNVTVMVLAGPHNLTETFAKFKPLLAEQVFHIICIKPLPEARGKQKLGEPQLFRVRS